MGNFEYKSTGWLEGAYYHLAFQKQLHCEQVVQPKGDAVHLTLLHNQGHVWRMEELSQNNFQGPQMVLNLDCYRFKRLM